MLARILGNILLAGLLWASAARAAEPLRLGLLHTLSPAPFYIAQERGYFRDEGIDLTFRFFEAAQPIAAAAVAGDIDVGVTALTGGFFNLAEKGTLKVIDLVNKVLQLLNSPLSPEILNLPEARLEIPVQLLSAAKAREKLSWAPRYTMDQGLDRTVDWYRNYFA